MGRLLVVIVALAGMCAVPVVADAQRGNPSLSITARPSTVTFGGSVAISGSRRGQNRANRPVGLQANPFPFRGFRDAGFTRTDRQGDYTFTQRPARHTRYRVISPSPASVYDTVIASAEVLVRVRLRVGVRLSDSTPRRGQRVRFFGTAAPKHNGHRVAIQRRRRDGRWITIALTRTRDATGNRSRYSRRVRIFRTGAYRVRVRGHSDHSTGTSRRRAIRVH